MIDWLIDWLIDVPSFAREVEPLLKGGIQLLLQNKDILAPSWMKEGNEGGNEQDEQTTDRKNERAQNEWLIDWLID